jgi:acyl carrier protein
MSHSATELAMSEPPQGEIEEELLRIWTEVLRIDKIGRNDSYFELGGDSLLATTIVHRIRDVFGVELPLRAIFELQTIKAIAEKIDAVYNEAIGDMTDEGFV